MALKDKYIFFDITRKRKIKIKSWHTDKVLRKIIKL